jgi:two-component system, NarL family, invasion response regulator UvrY
MSVRIGLVDDHKLFRKGMSELIAGFQGYAVIFEVNNGKELQQVVPHHLPDIVLLDIQMPEMNGYETASWLKEHYPQIKVLALSMYDADEAIIKMLKAGARGYLLKDAEPAELKKAFDDLLSKGYYHTELVSNKLLNNLHNETKESFKAIRLNDRETEFLKLACTEMTYKEIADKMCLAPRTIDGYRETLFEKLQVKSRVGLVIYAIKNGFVKIDG